MGKKCYLVTGGTGFLGSALTRRLLAEGHRVRILDNQSRGARRRIADLQDRVEILEGDIRDRETVLQAVAGVDAVCHLAYINGTEFFYSMPEVVLDVGIRGMLHVLDACIHHRVRELILASSSEVYQTPPRIPTDESVPLVVPDVLNPRYSYGGGKIACELLAIHFGRKYFDRVVIFRPHNVYGPDMGWEHVIPQFLVRMKAKIDAHEPDPIRFPIQGDGTETRAFVYIDDFTEGLMRVIEKGEHLGIYHIGTMEEVSIATVAELCAAFFGRKISIVPGERPAGGTLRRCPDITKLQALGYRPSVPLREGIAFTARWYVEHGDLCSHRDRAGIELLHPNGSNVTR